MTFEFDLGISGLLLLIGMSLVFGVIAQAVLWFATPSRWIWLIGAVGYFISGFYASEVLFSWATVEDLQPMIDGLLFDEALLGGLVLGIPVVLVGWYFTRQRRIHGPSST